MYMIARRDGGKMLYMREGGHTTIKVTRAKFFDTKQEALTMLELATTRGELFKVYKLQYELHEL